MKTFVLSLDDSGTRHPTHKVGKAPKHGYDWFALGGILYEEDSEKEIRTMHAAFCDKWGITAPLHSSEIRARASAFSFVGKLAPEKQKDFYEELYQLMAGLPAFGFGCVVDRPSYNARYLKMYDASKRWLLCKSAFSISVERAAKYVHSRGGRLRVYVEKSDKKTDRRMKEYYEELRFSGMPFDQGNSSKYDPADANFLQSTLFEFRLKNKSSPVTQFADLFVWPIAMGGYNPDCVPFKRLKSDEKLLDCCLKDEDVSSIGIKYYCFDMEKLG
jgi:hypothetical protein